jgi:hypothetical protein
MTIIEKKTATILIVSVMLLAFMTTASAQIMSFTYQGQLQNGGEPFTGTVDLEFELIGGPSGNLSLGTDQHPDHPVTNGLFQVELSFDLSTVAGARGLPELEFLPLNLAITVDGQPVTPLQAVSTAPRAFASLYSGYAARAGAPWQIVGDDLQYLDGRVGVGRAPSDFFVIDSGLEQQDSNYGFGTGALRVLVREPGGGGGLTKFRVLGNGGVAIGNSYNSSGVPVDGLRVQGQAVFESLGTFNDGVRVGENGNLSVVGLQAANPNNGDICFTELLPQSGPTVFRFGNCASSARYKNNIQPLDSAMELVRQLKPVSFDWSEDGRADIGLIAEEVAETEPRLAYFNSDGNAEGVNYRHLAAVLVAALQEQQTENTNQLAARDVEIAALRDELEAQRRDTGERLAALEALLTEGRQLAGGRL